ncbi:LssY C-terminal domain-containing protein [Novosphingobium terrae]|uniref:LssY C-terminal domain-containing protein n=1 Tax=Novosphingobium terrae TaxID=2726189 RepID=UPI001980B4CF|nr:LssY C-terminal domain-containing protein [Novosphingobium terrae]
MTFTGWAKDHRRHIGGTIVTIAWLLPILWFAMAYAGLPRIWSHHEHKKGKPLGDAVAYTAQDIPGDPINLKIDGSGAAIEAAMQRGGWVKADNVSVVSGLKIGGSVILGRPYPDAPVSPLFFNDKQQDFAYQHDEGRSADRRHHVRFWEVEPNHWVASATFDRGVGISLYTLQITHHIGPNVDQERDTVARILAKGQPISLVSLPGASQGGLRRNGGGDKYLTDGKVAQINLGSQRNR